MSKAKELLELLNEEGAFKLEVNGKLYAEDCMCHEDWGDAVLYSDDEGSDGE